MVNKYFIGGCLFWGGFLFCLYQICLRPGLHNQTFEAVKPKDRTQLAALISLLILLCIIPMGLTPFRNRGFDSYSRQYEHMAEALLEGRLYLDYGDMDEGLLRLENPYDPAEREEAGVSYHWDHAFYDGHYYMYFGVVPVILLFLPFRAITGMSLDTLDATRIFVALFICGVFAVLYLIAFRFFRQMTKGMYLLLSSAVALMSIWYSVDAPILYCTAITAGLCMEIWSLFFFMKAVWIEKAQKRQIFYAFCGSIFGALAFGCRPPVALANLLALPLLGIYLKGRKLELKLIRQLCLAASPYIVIGIGLMLYNYARFDSPFEFGQTYQLTLADQSGYTDVISRFSPVKIWNGILENFISSSSLGHDFPFISFYGALVNFPVLLVPLAGLTHKEIQNKIRKRNLGWFTTVLLLLPVIITVAEVVWAPFLIERYRMDLYWLMGILCFIVAGLFVTERPEQERKRISLWMSLAAFATVISCMLLFTVPYDGNFSITYPGMLEEIRRVLAFGRNF